MPTSKIYVAKEKTRENISELMTAHNHTHGDLSKIIGISGTATKNYTAGKNLPSLQILGILAKIYNVKLDDIVVYKEDNAYERLKSKNNQKTN